jgi:hypothetical protein
LINYLLGRFVREAKSRAISDGLWIDPAIADATVAEIRHLIMWYIGLLHLRARGFAPFTKIPTNPRVLRPEWASSLEVADCDVNQRRSGPKG